MKPTTSFGGLPVDKRLLVEQGGICGLGIHVHGMKTLVYRPYHFGLEKTSLSIFRQ